MTDAKQKILMCAPDYFGVTYVINPWMEGHLGDSNPTLAHQQWQNLRDRLAEHAEIVLQPPQPGLPDLVFTANAGLVRGKKAIVSRFRNFQRQGEEMHDQAWFASHQFDVVDWPLDVCFEGAGDALFDRGHELLWIGHGFRSDEAAPVRVEEALGCRTIILNLVDPRFYHLDTCLCPLTGGYLMYFPAAFDAASNLKIEALVPENKRFVVDEGDATQFCCNAVNLDDRVFLNGASDGLQNRLRSSGFTPVITPLSEFMKAGGAAKCLTLKLIEP